MALDSARVNVCYTIDRNYTLPLAVSLYSLLENFSQTRQLCVYVLHDAVPSEERARIEDSVAPVLRKGIQLEFLAYEGSTFADLRTTLHFSAANYARHHIPALLPSTVAKVVCLDADTLVLSDISMLFDEDPGDFPVKLAPDWTGHLGHPLLDMPKDLSPWGASLSDKYFNVGVQLLNLSMWREEKISEIGRAHV